MLFDILLQVVLGYFVIKFITRYFEQRNQELEAEVDGIVDHVRRHIHVVRQETHQDQLYWFERNNDSFIAQGISTEDVIDRARLRYPKHVFLLLDTEENLSEIVSEITEWRPEPIDRHLEKLRNINLNFPR